jgi:hypothetical protein
LQVHLSALQSPAHGVQPSQQPFLTQQPSFFSQVQLSGVQSPAQGVDPSQQHFFFWQQLSLALQPASEDGEPHFGSSQQVRTLSPVAVEALVIMTSPSITT